MGLGQDKQVCRRPLGALRMARVVSGAETAGGTVAWGELEGMGGGDGTPPFIAFWPINTIAVCI
jgi:hypothetical protein